MTGSEIAQACATPGLIGLGQIQWLAKEAACHQRIVDFGSFLGRSTRALADNTLGTVYAIDNWNGPWDIDLPTDIRKNLYAMFCENLKDHLDSGRVVVIKTDHHFPPRGLMPDMVFIDGDHGAAAVLRDILFWRNELSVGG